MPGATPRTGTVYPELENRGQRAQSLGGFTAPIVRKPVQMIVLLNASDPQSGESPNDWWGDFRGCTGDGGTLGNGLPGQSRDVVVNERRLLAETQD